MIKYIASDLDGTLLLNGAQSLNPEVFDLILKLKEKGIHFIAASGRQYNNIRRLFAPIKDEISYVAENGSLCVHNHQVISRGEIERELGLRILKSTNDYPTCNCFVSGEQIGYTTSKNQFFINHMRNVVHGELTTIDNWEDIDEPFLKIAMCDFNGTKEMVPFFKERFSKEINIVTSGNIWVDFIAPNANKATALANLLKHLNFSPEDGISFGDQLNDIEMLQLTGTAYAMINAAPEVSKHATHITDSVENVMREILKKL